MKTKIDERKNIIISLKTNYGERKKGIEKRIQYLKIMSSINLILIIFCGGILLVSIISGQFGNELIKWQKMGLLAILSLSCILNLPNELYELKLLKHLKRINAVSEFNGIEKLNNELKSIIENLNNRLKNNWLVIILAIGIIFMGMIQVISESINPYWNYMKSPILLFFGIVTVRYLTTNKKLTKNINEIEKYCS